jgi:hypothetical protein
MLGNQSVPDHRDDIVRNSDQQDALALEGQAVAQGHRRGGLGYSFFSVARYDDLAHSSSFSLKDKDGHPIPLTVDRMAVLLTT